MRSRQAPGSQMASLPFIQGWYARLFSNTYGENVISIWRDRSLPSVISTSLQHKCQDDGIQLLALLLPFCFGVHYHLPPNSLCSHPTSPPGMPGTRCLGCDQLFTRIDRHWGQNILCSSIHLQRIQNNTLFPVESSSAEGSSSSSSSSSFGSNALEPCIQHGFVGSLICVNPPTANSRPSAGHLGTTLHHHQQDDGSIVSRRTSQRAHKPMMKRRRLDEDARSRRNRNNDEDSSAQWMPPPPDDDNISLLSFSQTHPEDDIGEGYPSDLEDQWEDDVSEENVLSFVAAAPPRIQALIPTPSDGGLPALGTRHPMPLERSLCQLPVLDDKELALLELHRILSRRGRTSQTMLRLCC